MNDKEPKVSVPVCLSCENHIHHCKEGYDKLGHSLCGCYVCHSATLVPPASEKKVVCGNCGHEEKYHNEEIGCQVRLEEKFVCDCGKPPSRETAGIDAMVRDFTSVVPRTKSEVRRRIEEALAQARNEGWENEGWENDFYEVLPIVCSPLTADAKVARIKIIFEKLLAAAEKRGKEKGLKNCDEK